MEGRGTDIARIGTIVFEAHHSGLFKECLDFAEIFIAPVAAQTRGTAESHAAPFPRLRIDDIHLVADPAARQQGVASHLEAFALGVIHQRLELRDVLLRDIFCIRSGAKAQDNHLVARLGTLVHGTADSLRFAGSQVHEYRILRSPRSQCPIETPREQSFPFPVVAVEGHFIDAE